MATRASRSGRKIPVTAADDTGLTFTEYRAKIKPEKIQLVKTAPPLPISSPSPTKKRRTCHGTISCTGYEPLCHAFYNKPVFQYFFAANVICGIKRRMSLVQEPSRPHATTNALQVTQVISFLQLVCSPTTREMIESAYKSKNSIDDNKNQTAPLERSSILEKLIKWREVAMRVIGS